MCECLQRRRTTICTLVINSSFQLAGFVGTNRRSSRRRCPTCTRRDDGVWGPDSKGPCRPGSHRPDVLRRAGLRRHKHPRIRFLGYLIKLKIIVKMDKTKKISLIYYLSRSSTIVRYSLPPCALSLIFYMGLFHVVEAKCEREHLVCRVGQKMHVDNGLWVTFKNMTKVLQTKVCQHPLHCYFYAVLNSSFILIPLSQWDGNLL